MLILVGTVPTAYALNHAVGRADIVRPSPPSPRRPPVRFSTTSIPAPSCSDAEPELESFVSTHKWTPDTMLALSQEITDIRNEAVNYGSLERRSRRHAGQRPQPDVPRQRGHPPPAEVRPQDVCSRRRSPRQLRRPGSTSPPSSSPHGSRSLSRSRLAWARWSAGSASSSRSARRSARPT